MNGLMMLFCLVVYQTPIDTDQQVVVGVNDKIPSRLKMNNGMEWTGMEWDVGQCLI